MEETLKKIFLVFCFLFSGCNEKVFSVESLITDFIEKECNTSQSCIVSIQTLVHFKWSKMYVFRYDASDEQIEQVLHLKINGRHEFTKKWLFMYGDNIVHFEEHEIDFEQPLEDELVFSMGDDKKFVEYTPTTAVFTIARKKWGERHYYKLEPLLENN